MGVNRTSAANKGEAFADSSVARDLGGSGFTATIECKLVSFIAIMALMGKRSLFPWFLCPEVSLPVLLR